LNLPGISHLVAQDLNLVMPGTQSDVISVFAERERRNYTKRESKSM